MQSGFTDSQVLAEIEGILSLTLERVGEEVA
jgi:hypothetical protein